MAIAIEIKFQNEFKHSKIVKQKAHVLTIGYLKFFIPEIETVKSSHVAAKYIFCHRLCTDAA